MRLTGTIVAIDKADETLSIITGGSILMIDVGALRPKPKLAVGIVFQCTER